MNVPKLNDDGRHMYFVSIRLAVDVHVRALGFTNSVFEFAYAGSPEEAQDLARMHYESKNLPVLTVAASYAIQQDPAQYTFPEAILRNRPLADVWRGEVCVHPEYLCQLEATGACREAQIGERLFVFSAPEPVAVDINRSNARYIGMMKPCMSGSPTRNVSDSKLAA